VNSWVVVYKDAYQDWAEDDLDIRLQVHEWVLQLALSGPPSGSLEVPGSRMREVIEPSTGTIVQYLDLDRLSPPCVAIKRFC
jgi:hypothetical protein